MSVNPDGMDSTDYSDFEYQQVYLQHQSDPSGDNTRSVLQFDIEPLGGIGGLDNNEVAELVYLEVQTAIKHTQAGSDQDVGSETQFSGVVGANLPPSQDLLPLQGTSPDSTVVAESNAETNAAGSVDSEDRVFVPFRTIKHPAFDDQTNGPGGAGEAETVIYERPFRDLTGRGPVLDSSDSLSTLSTLRQEDEIIQASAVITLHCIWDVAETSDAGRAFSVPTDD